MFKKLWGVLAGKPQALPLSDSEIKEKQFQDELTRIDPQISAQQLLEGFKKGKISGRAFNKLADSAQVDIIWFTRVLEDAIEQRDWHSVCDAVAFSSSIKSEAVNALLGQALRSSFDDIIAESNPNAVWGTPEMIVEAMMENDPNVVADLAHVCRLPENVPEGWYLDYRKAVDAIERTEAMPVTQRLTVLQELLGHTEIDGYIQEAIERLRQHW